MASFTQSRLNKRRRNCSLQLFRAVHGRLRAKLNRTFPITCLRLPKWRLVTEVLSQGLVGERSAVFGLPKAKPLRGGLRPALAMPARDAARRLVGTEGWSTSVEPKDAGSGCRHGQRGIERPAALEVGEHVQHDLTTALDQAKATIQALLGLNLVHGLR